MIEIRILNLILVCIGFTSLMFAFAHQIKCLKVKFTGSRMFKFWFLLACLGFCCYEIWNLRFERGTTLAIWNLWAIVISYLLTRYNPFRKEDDEDIREYKHREQHINSH